MSDETTIRCDVTGKTVPTKLTASGKPRLPRGWKRSSGLVYCDQAWKQAYMIRAVILPVLGPSSAGDQASRKAAWMVLRERLRASWQASTATANWALKQLAANDIIREPGMAKLPKMQPLYLYGMGNGRWDGWSQSASAVLRTIELAYRAKRYDRIWLGKTVLSDVRYPYPYPVHNAVWRAWRGDGGEACVSLPLVGGRTDLVVRLRAKGRKGRRVAQFDWLAEHQELRGEAAIYERGRERQLVVKLVGWFPRQANQDRRGILRVMTDADAFIVALNESKDQLWTINGDDFRRTLLKHCRWQQRFREDLKYEDRMPARRRRVRMRPMSEGAAKFRARQRNFIQQTTAKIAGFADRNRLATVMVDMHYRGYLERFAWHEWQAELGRKLAERGIDIEVASGEVVA